MKLQDCGSFFYRMADDSIWVLLYIKTNHMLKMRPTPKLMDFDRKTGKFIEKSHSPNKIWYVLFDKNGRDYVSSVDYPMGEIEKILKKTKEFYDYKDYTAVEMYDKFKESGLKSTYTKKWFENSYKFIDGQIENMKR